MVLAREYLERNYPQEGVCRIDDSQEWSDGVNNKGKKRAQITELVLSKKNLSGTLDLSDFVNLEELYCWDNQLTKLILPQSNKLRIINCSDNQLTSLDCANYPQLKKLWCWDNQLSQLILPTNNQLENINFADNLLTTFDYTQLNPQTCTDLRLFNNQFAATDLSVFSPLVNLTDLDIGDTNNDNLNKFFGSLEALKNCAKLKTLDIRNTNVNQGLEYLPASLENFAYSSLAGSNFQVQELEREINKWRGGWKKYREKLLSEWENKWKKQGFGEQEVKEWTKNGLTFNDRLLAHYLQQDGYQAQQVNKDNLAELRKKTAWQDLHEDFDNKCQIRDEWEKKNFIHSDVKEWLNLGFQPKDYDNPWLNLSIAETKEWLSLGFSKGDYQKVKGWKDRNFKVQEVKGWLSLGFSLENYQEAGRWKEIDAKEAQEWIALGFKINEHQEVKEWKEKGFTPAEFKQWESLGINLKNTHHVNDWKKQGFAYEQVKSWVNVGLKINEFDFAKDLQEQGHQPNTPNIKAIIQQESWQKLHPDFTYSLRKSWENQGFDSQKTQEWINAGFDPGQLELVQRWKNINFTAQEIKEWIKSGLTKDEHVFTDYLKNERKLTSQIISRDQLIELKNEYFWWQESFDLEQRKEWFKAGAKMDDYRFASWFKDTKQLGPEWITNYQTDYQILSERFKKYGSCPECQRLNTGEQWCQACNAQHLQADFANWTSSNQEIDELIRKYQSDATDANKLLEWIPYQQFTNVQYLAEGGFGKVYQAQWKAGNIHHWDQKNQQWAREKDHYYSERDKIEWDFKQNSEKYKKYKNHRTIVLKSLTNSQDSTDFLQETEKFKIIDDWFNNIVPCYGISQDPATGNYLMVMQYLPQRDLRNYLKKNNRDLKLADKIAQLANIARGLKDIHQKTLVHHDFHLGNILKGIEQTSCLITDLGLCKPADQIQEDEKIFGVLPYVAPEVLQGQLYTSASDIYSFGIVAYELLTGLPPYYDRAHDEKLGAEICAGLRPQFKIKVPELLEKLINKCWDDNPTQRSTAIEIERELQNLGEQSKFKQQIRDADWNNKTLPESVRFPKYQIHKKACYTSRLLPTKEIVLLFQEEERKALEKELKKMEKDTNQKLTDEQKKIVSGFIQACKKREKGDKQVTKKDIKSFKDRLKEENLEGKDDENIEKIINYCMRFVKLEQELEAHIEILTIKEQ